MTLTIGRRELLAALGGAAVAWPLAAGAQQQIEKCEQRRRRHYDEPARVSAVDGAGSAMLFSVAAAI